MSFYRLQDNSLLEASDYVIGPGVLLKADLHESYTYPCSGWHWFDTKEDAESFFSQETTEQKVTASNQAMQELIAQHIAGAGVAVLTLGIAAGLPKALAVKNWVAGLWVEYETRKASVAVTGICSTDYSAMPPCPHSLAELIAEAGLL